MKKAAIGGAIAAAIVIAVAVGYYTNQEAITKSNLDIQRKHGTIDTSMGSPILGSVNAPITIIEFGDYQCPQCDAWFNKVRPSIENDYINTGKANLVFVDLAFFGPDSVKAAEASYCAEEQGKYWEYHNILYSNQRGTNDGWASAPNLKNFASQIGLDMNLFSSCLDSDKYEKRVQHNIQVAKSSGASGTPTFVLVSSKGGQQKIEGAQPYTVFKQTLETMS